jgi:hypothetical protein
MASQSASYVRHFTYGETPPYILCAFWLGSIEKDKVHPRFGREGPAGEERLSYTLSLTSLLDGVGSKRHAATSIPMEK